MFGVSTRSLREKLQDFCPAVREGKKASKQTKIFSVQSVQAALNCSADSGLRKIRGLW